MPALYHARRLDQAFGGGAGLVGDLGAGQHAGDLLAPFLGRHLGDAGGDPLALFQRVLADEIMAVGARRHLRGVGHRQHLHAGGELGQPHADGVGHGAADAGVDLVEHQSRRRAAVGEHHLERQQEARQFAAGGDLHQRPGPRAGIGLHPEFDPVDAVRPGGGGIADDLGGKFRPLQLERLEFGIDRLVERAGRLGARFRQSRRPPRDSRLRPARAAASSALSRSSPASISAISDL